MRTPRENLTISKFVKDNSFRLESESFYLYDLRREVEQSYIGKNPEVIELLPIVKKYDNLQIHLSPAQLEENKVKRIILP
jgi:hypothetical protein